VRLPSRRVASWFSQAARRRGHTRHLGRAQSRDPRPRRALIVWRRAARRHRRPRGWPGSRSSTWSRSTRSPTA